MGPRSHALRCIACSSQAALDLNHWAFPGTISYLILTVA
jgi:hypothetical protein